MQKKNKNLNNKVVIIVAIVTIIVLISIIVIQNVIINNGVKENNYLASGNSNSELLAKYIQKGITIGGITGTLESLDTSDATATAADILSGKTAYANGNKLTGILEMLDTSDATATTADILSGKTAYVNGNKITGTLTSSQYKFATGRCNTNYVDGGGLWCSVSGLSFTPGLVFILGIFNKVGIAIAWGSNGTITLPGQYFGNTGMIYENDRDYFLVDFNFTSSYGGFTFSAVDYSPDLDLNRTYYYAIGI